MSSPHTIRVFDFGVTADGTFYYVMELLSGRDLESLVREFGPVPADRAIHLLRQVCHSLADAHARGLVHRDIKPANIYVCRMGLEYDFVKVLDFGLVKFNDQQHHAADADDRRRTRRPARRRSWRRKSFSAGEVDRRADVYALGCVAYYLLTGQLVFEARHADEDVPAAPADARRFRRRSAPSCRFRASSIGSCWPASKRIPNKRPQDAEELLRMARAAINRRRSLGQRRRETVVGDASAGADRPAHLLSDAATRTSSERPAVAVH